MSILGNIKKKTKLDVKMQVQRGDNGRLITGVSIGNTKCTFTLRSYPVCCGSCILTGLYIPHSIRGTGLMRDMTSIIKFLACYTAHVSNVTGIIVRGDVVETAFEKTGWTVGEPFVNKNHDTLLSHVSIFVPPDYDPDLINGSDIGCTLEMEMPTDHIEHQDREVRNLNG